MKKNIRGLLILFTLLLYVSLSVNTLNVNAKVKEYTISPSSKPYKNANVKSKSYNKNTKHYYVLMSYMKQMEKNGGGVLTLKKGTYKVTNAINVPSNVTIKLSDGVVIKKITKTGTSSLKASKNLFQFVNSSKVNKKNSYTKFNGVKNAAIIGSGNATIDLGKTGATGIYMGHDKNIKVEGVTFKTETNSGYILNIAGSSNVTVKKCKFVGKGRKGNAVLIDPLVKGITQTRKWVKSDDTVTKNVSISNNSFKQLNRAIATIRYAKDKYHTGIEITDNTISDIKDDAIRAINWDKPKIEGNKFNKINDGAKAKAYKRAIYLAGVKNPTILKNIFDKLPRAIQIDCVKNSDKAIKKFPATKNKIKDIELKQMVEKNTYKSVGEYFIRYYKSYGTKDCILTYVPDNTNTYKVTPSSNPYRNSYVTSETYNNNTKQYYMLRSYMDQIERNGGGTLVLGKGTYTLTNEVPIASNVIIKFEDGVEIKKSMKTGNNKITASTGLFAFVEPSDYSKKGVYKEYNGVKNVKLIGPASGSAKINLNFVEGAIGLVMCHNYNIRIENLDFVNMNGAHFIELDASKNVTIINNTFSGHRDSDGNYKEAINLDTPDKATLGFIREWTSYDKTPNNDITIENNKFSNLERAIGTHAYSPNKWHKNINIKNNVINKCDNDAIKIMNWENTVITGNVIKNIGNGSSDKKRAVKIEGAKNPTITNNTFSDMARPIEITVGKMYEGTSTAVKYDTIFNVISQDNKIGMLKNKLINVNEHYIYYSNVLNPSSGQIEKWVID